MRVKREEGRNFKEETTAVENGDDIGFAWRDCTRDFIYVTRAYAEYRAACVRVRRRI
jgi:hypothetical protein